MPQSVPDAAGVYYLLDRYQKPLYIGKAGNIKKRILTHDYAENGVLSRHGEWIRFLKWELTGNNVIASLLEDHRIRSYWPPLNRAQKSKPLKFAVEYYVDRQERWRMSVVSKKSYRTNPLIELLCKQQNYKKSLPRFAGIFYVRFTDANRVTLEDH